MPNPSPPNRPAPLTARQFLDQAAAVRDFRAVPAAALRFAADVTTEPKVTTTGDPIVTILARTGQPINHYYWGRAVHDMAGFVPPPSAVPLDYCHNDAEVLGFGDEFDTQPTGLTVRGALTPFTPTDRAAEVASKMPRGVPYQASISFPNDGLSLEELPPGVTAEVNGYALTGPAVIFRRWTIRGVAICPYGYDAGTIASVEPFDLTNQPQDPAMHIQKPATPPAAPAPVATNLTATAEAPPAGSSAPAADPTKPAAAAAAETVETETEETAAATTETPAGETKLSAGQEYVAAYGPQGAVWFIEGKTPAEAARLFGQQQASEAARLAKENADLRAQVTSLRGEPNALHVDAPRTEAAKQTTDLATQLGSETVARIVAGCKLPGKK